MAEFLGRFTLFIAAVHTAGDCLALLFTGGSVFYEFKTVFLFDLLFAAAAGLAVLLVVLFDRCDLPVVQFRICDGFLALEAEFIAHRAVFCLAVFRLRMLTCADLAAACADGRFCAVLRPLV